MLQQLLYELSAAAGKDYAVATGGHLMGKMLEKMHVGGMADIYEYFQAYLYLY